MARARKQALVLVVVDGLSARALELGLAARRLPTLAYMLEHGEHANGTTTFPSLTPVCLTTIATGTHPDVHGIPHLAWLYRDEQRLVEYGSSSAAVRAAGTRQALRDSIVEMSHRHVSRAATTVFEAVEDAGLVAAAINFTCYRGRHRHELRLAGSAARNRWYGAVWGPQRFFFFNLYESDPTGAPLAVRSRSEGSVDRYAEAVGRWLVTRDGFDFLVYYLPDYDYAAHSAGPEGALDALARADACLGALLDAAGGPEAFLDRYALLVAADHGQTPVDRAGTLADAFADLHVWQGRRKDGEPAEHDVAVPASNRAGMVYRLPRCRIPLRELAARAEAEPWADITLFREGDHAVARRGGAEVRFAPAEPGWVVEGDADLLEPDLYPNALERSWRALACRNAGDVIVSPALGWELRDLGGHAHVGGGSHGSLVAGDSVVPMIAVGFEAPVFPDEPQTADLAPLVLAHFGIESPATMRRAARVPA